MTTLIRWVTASSLRQRILTALVLGPLVMAAVLWLPTPGFALFIAVVILVGAWEWAGLAGIEALPASWAISACSVRSLPSCGSSRTGDRGCCGSAPPGGSRRPSSWRACSVSTRGRALTRLPRAAGLLVLCAPWAALVELQATAALGPALVLFLFLLVWIADSAAYFAGRRWGRTKLAPLLSPGKTRAGVYGGLVSAVLGGVLLGYALSLSVQAACWRRLSVS